MPKFIGMNASVYCGYLDNANWLKQSACNFTVGIGEVDIWLISASLQSALLGDYKDLLNAAENERAARYSDEADRHRFTISKGVSKVLLGRYLQREPSLIEFLRDKKNKPYLKKSTHLYFNVSHSGDYILVAVSGSEIGVDIEQINPALDFKDIMADQFSVEEVSYVNQSTLPYEAFYAIWTRKEALLKATGLGLDFELVLVPGLDGQHQMESSCTQLTDWEVNTFKIGDNYFASIACKSKGTTYRIIKYD